MSLMLPVPGTYGWSIKGPAAPVPTPSTRCAARTESPTRVNAWPGAGKISACCSGEGGGGVLPPPPLKKCKLKSSNLLMCMYVNIGGSRIL